MLDMATRAQKIRLSLFLIATGSLLLVFFIVLVGSRLLKRMNTYHIVYANISVNGLEPGAVFFTEWRDSHDPYRIGPRVWMNGAGEISSGGKVLLKVPVSQWMGIEIECPLGKDANGTFNMTVTVTGQPPQRFDALPCGNPSFRKLDWLGFVSNATEAATTYVDDVKIESK